MIFIIGYSQNLWGETGQKEYTDGWFYVKTNKHGICAKYAC